MPVNPQDGQQDQAIDAGLLLSARAVFDLEGPVAVAVSGGGDSVALLHLLHRAAVAQGRGLCAVTVDHALRPASASEADAVGRLCADLDIPHQTLRWDHGAIRGNLMDQARQARRKLIADWAKAQGIARVALGHTADDEAETVLMALARASGLDGLAGMRGSWQQDGLHWSRPLLRHSRAELRNYLRRHGIAWVDDPSNENPQFTRVRARAALAALAPLGITAQAIAASANHLKSAQDALQDMLLGFVSREVVEAGGALQIPQAAFATLPQDLQRRLLNAAIGWLSGAAYPARGAKQIALLAAVTAGKTATLAGCRFRCAGGFLHICREARAVAGVACATDQLWDQRWQITGPHAADLTIRALGSQGLPQIKDWRSVGLPRDVLLVSPAIWRDDALIAAPVAGFSNEWQAKPSQGLASFILSH